MAVDSLARLLDRYKSPSQRQKTQPKALPASTTLSPSLPAYAINGVSLHVYRSSNPERLARSSSRRYSGIFGLTERLRVRHKAHVGRDVVVADLFGAEPRHGGRAVADQDAVPSPAAWYRVNDWFTCVSMRIKLTSTRLSACLADTDPCSRPRRARSSSRSAEATCAWDCRIRVSAAVARFAMRKTHSSGLQSPLILALSNRTSFSVTHGFNSS